MATVKTNTAEQAVRSYLEWLRDPSSAVDETAVADARSRLDAEKDPIARLQLHAELQAAANVDGDAIEAAFVKHAKTFAEANGLSAVSFMEVHSVPGRVLRDAGFKVPRRRTSNGPRVGREQVIEAIPTSGNFTIRQVEESCGASNATVRNVVNDLVATGDVKVVGPDPDHEGKGKPPTLYTRA